MATSVESVLGAAESALGVQYKWGGNSLGTGVDCSGLVQQAFLAAGIQMPRVSRDQANVGQAVGSLDDAQPGDLLAWDNGPRNNGADHVGIYLGNGLMIVASRTGQPVQVQKVYGTPTVRRVIGAVEPTYHGEVFLGPNADRSVTTYSIAAAAGGAAHAGTAAPAAVASATVDTAPPEGGLGDDLAPDATPEQVDAYIKDHFPALATFMGDTAIHMLLVAAAKDDWSDEKLTQAIEQTDYWKSHSAPSRAFDAFLATAGDAEVNRVIGQAEGIVGDAFQRNGVPLDDKTVGELAKQAIRNGVITLQGQLLDPAGLNDMLAFGIGATPGGIPAGGEAGASVDQLRSIARNYLIPVDDHTLNDWALRIVNGTATVDSFTSYVTGLAKGQWGSDKDVIAAIDNGTSPAQFFAPHRSLIAQTLELSPDQVDLFDPRFREVTQFVDPKTGQRRSMTLTETDQWARHQQAFRGTRQFTQERAAKGVGLVQRLGLVA